MASGTKLLGNMQKKLTNENLDFEALNERLPVKFLYGTFDTYNLDGLNLLIQPIKKIFWPWNQCTLYYQGSVWHWSNHGIHSQVCNFGDTIDCFRCL